MTSTTYKMGRFKGISSYSPVDSVDKLRQDQRKMSYHPSLTAFSLTMLVALSCAHISGHSFHQDVGSHYYCGRSLARAIAFLCYDELSSEKRSEAGTMYNSVLTPYYQEQENNIGWPWIPVHKARALGLPSRGKRVVVSECCDKACSIEELLSYCS